MELWRYGKWPETELILVMYENIQVNKKSNNFGIDTENAQLH